MHTNNGKATTVQNPSHTLSDSDVPRSGSGNLNLDVDVVISVNNVTVTDTLAVGI